MQDPSSADTPRDRQARARARVVEYYDHCWDDYRVLWRTDENGSVHFGFFDVSDRSLRQPLRVIGSGVVALGATVVAGFSALLGGRAAAIDWLRVAARGRARQHDAAQRRTLGGLGGCPYAPGASGNVCTEEIVHALELMGYDTGCDLAVLLEAARRLPALIGHDIPSQVAKAGRRLDLHQPPADFATWRDRALARD